MAEVELNFKFIGDQEKDSVSNFELGCVNKVLQLAFDSGISLVVGESVEGHDYMFNVEKVRYSKTFRHTPDKEAEEILIMTYVYDVVRITGDKPFKVK